MTEQEQQRIKALRKFFSITLIAFECADKISEVFGKTAPIKTRMHELHLIAKIEIDKDNPDMKLIDGLLLEMENEALKNSHEA